jgi:hypothetical protein
LNRKTTSIINRSSIGNKVADIVEDINRSGNVITFVDHVLFICFEVFDSTGCTAQKAIENAYQNTSQMMKIIKASFSYTSIRGK